MNGQMTGDEYGKVSRRTRSDAARIGGLARVNPANLEIRNHRKLEAVSLRLEGNSYREIAEKLQISRSLAHELCIEAFAEEQGEGKERAARIRTEQLALMETLQCRLLRSISENEGASDVESLAKASAALAKLWDRQAKLLGLDTVPANDSGSGGFTALELARRLADRRSRVVATSVHRSESR